jgi:hypothetical protein
MDTLADLAAEVKALADERTPDLLPMLLAKLKHTGLHTCDKHTRLLTEYTIAAVGLTKIKRRWYEGSVHCGMVTVFVNKRDATRRAYRDARCDCWHELKK